MSSKTRKTPKFDYIPNRDAGGQNLLNLRIRSGDFDRLVKQLECDDTAFISISDVARSALELGLSFMEEARHD